MHARAIAYNQAHDILITFDGANRESTPYFVDQTQPYITIMQRVYRSYGMEYSCPVFEIDNTDKVTETYGLTVTKDTKKEHVVFSTQHTCLMGLAVHAHARLYYRPFRGKDRTSRLGGEFLERMIDDCRSLFPDPLAADRVQHP